MRKILIFIVFLYGTQNVFAHKEWVHQYILKEAYRFLNIKLGKPIPAMYRQIRQYNNGTLNSNDIAQFQGKPAEHSPSATIGIFREDNFDAVYGYAGGFPPGKVSITHFLVPDNGLHRQTEFDFVLGPAFGIRPNAFDKALAYCFGRPFFSSWPGHFGLEGDYSNTYFGNTPGYDTYFQGIQYGSLVDLYKNDKLRVTGYAVKKDDAGVWYDTGVEAPMSLEKRELFTMHFLGRVIHLLTDMSVPAHVKADTHPCDAGDGDTFELEMGANLVAMVGCNNFNSDFPARQWTAETAMSDDLVGGGFIFTDYQLQNLGDVNIIAELFYSTSQLADFFPSIAYKYSVEPGWGILGWLFNNINNFFNPYQFQQYGNVKLTGFNEISEHPSLRRDVTDVYLANVYQKMLSNPSFLKAHSGASPLFFSDFYNVRGKILINYAIRATATLLRWFMLRAGIDANYETDPTYSLSVNGPRYVKVGKVGHYSANILGIGLNDPAWFYYSQGAQYTWDVEYKFPDVNDNYTLSFNTEEIDVAMDGAATQIKVTLKLKPNHPDLPLRTAVLIMDPNRQKEGTVALAAAKQPGGSGMTSAVAPRVQLRSTEVTPKSKTTLSYSLTGDTHVKLEVLNAQHHQVAELVQAVQPSGSYTKDFDVSALNPGVYVVRLVGVNQQTGEQIRTATPLYVKR